MRKGRNSIEVLISSSKIKILIILYGNYVIRSGGEL